jgi:hypothetical protein
LRTPAVMLLPTQGTDFVNLWTERIDRLANRFSVASDLESVSRPSESRAHQPVIVGRIKLRTLARARQLPRSHLLKERPDIRHYLASPFVVRLRKMSANFGASEAAKVADR